MRVISPHSAQLFRDGPDDRFRASLPEPLGTPALDPLHRAALFLRWPRIFNVYDPFVTGDNILLKAIETT
jgi:hypothetical protein